MEPMKYLFIAFLLSLSTGIAQNQLMTPEKDRSSQKIHPIDGTPFLEAPNKEVYNYFRENPDALTQQKLNKAQSWGFTVGTNKSFYAYDFTTDTRYSTAFTCRAVGNNCYIFVENSLWETRVFQAGVDSVLNAFDSHTPANPSLGIYQMDVNAFGDPPDVDNDPRIVILILNIKDGFSGSGGYIAGYFSSYNELPSTSYPESNAGEFYYVDGNPLNLTTPDGIQTAMSTAAHEFQHMINWNYHKTQPELTFINEGLSEVAQIICGYGAELQSLFANEPNHYLFDWRTSDITLVLNDYARAQRFFIYIMEQFGVESLKQIVQDYSTFGSVGISGLNKVLSQNYSTSIGKVFINFNIANGLNNIVVHPAYGYSYQPIPTTTGSVFYNPNINQTSSTLQRLGAEYFTFSKSSNLHVTFTSSGSNFIVKAIEIGDGSSRVIDVPLNTPFSELDYPSVYSTIRFAVIDTNQSFNQDYQYQASGEVSTAVTELKWDNTEPTGYLDLPAGDTVCVVFNPFSGARLDSVKVGLRRAGSIAGGIWVYNSRGAPLKTKLAGPFTTSITTTPDVPYPVPWTNWSTIDLTSANISTDQSFAVAFAIPSSNDPKVMITETNGTDYANSLTYAAGSGWLYYTSNNNTTYQYLIRAYVSLVTSAGTETVVELTPADFSLSQNYPNPFNPTTTIGFKIPEKRNVRMAILNILGEEIKILLNEEKEAGYHLIDFSASDLPSGVYFYRIQSGSFIDTKKLLLLK